MTDIVVDRLSIRGPAGRRLAGIAARALPAALDEALGDLEDGELGRLHVRIDLDVAGYDERTLAVLWADAVRRSALEAGARIAVRPHARREPGEPGQRAAPTGSGTPEPPGPSRSAGHSGTTTARDVRVEDVVRAALAWLSAGAPPSAVPVAALQVADPDVAREALERLGPTASRSLVARLGALRHHGAPAPAVASPALASPAAGIDVPQLAGTPDESPRSRDGATDRAPTPTAGPPAPDATALASAASPLRELSAIASATGSTVDLLHVTRVAGLLLLYPWLRDLYHDALTGAPGLAVGDIDPEGTDPVVVDLRRRVLARLADPTDRALVDDPLIRLLAGAPVAGAARPLDEDDAPPTATDERSDRLLRGFAALLPGFGASSPEFVRSAWLRRDGVIESDGPMVRIAARTLPLDIVLSHLPYPLGLIRLPWTPPMSVALRP